MSTIDRNTSATPATLAPITCPDTGKVAAIRPQAERFQDARVWRFAKHVPDWMPPCSTARDRFFHSTASPTAKAYRRRQLAADAGFHVAIADAKADRRFAIFPLMAALHRCFGWLAPRHGGDLTSPLRGLLLTKYAPAFAQEGGLDFHEDEKLMDSIDWEYVRAHPSKSDPVKIACWPTRADARRRREVVMTAGRYFQAAGVGDAAAVQLRAERYIQSQAPAVVHFAETADEWAWAYAASRGFTSCMSGDWEAGDSNNPVRFYAYPGNGLALAYITDDGDGDDGGDVVGRCIVNRERMLAVRTYGDQRLTHALVSMGFRLGSEVRAYPESETQTRMWGEPSTESALRGVRCRRIERGGRLVGPWVDGHPHGSDHGDFITIGSGELDLQCTGGYISNSRVACECCRDRTHEDDMTYVSNGDLVCEDCLDQHYMYAVVSTSRHGHNYEYVHDDYVVRTTDGVAFADDRELLMDAGYVCDDNGDWRPEDDCVYLEYLGEYVPIDECTQLDVPHGDDGYARAGDTITVVLHGEELNVHEDYAGPTDESIAKARKEARTKARAKARRKLRHYSRAPGRKSARACLSCRRRRLFDRIAPTA